MCTTFGLKAQTFVVGDLSYTVLDAEKKTVVAKGNNKAVVNLVIPATVDNEGVTYTVTETAERAFEGYGAMTSVDVPKSLVKFGKYSFNNAKLLKKTIIHDINAWCKIDFSGSCISSPAWYSHNLYLGDKLLEDVVITEPITEIKDMTFYYVETVRTVKLPGTVTKIGAWGFAHSGIRTIDLPKGLTTSLKYAFQYCDSLREINMPDNWTEIVNATFKECRKLEKVVIAKNLKVIPTNLFQSCNSLADVTYPDRLEEIQKGAFVATPQKKLDFPKTLKTIKDQAFFANKDLEEITFGPNVNFIGYLAFYVDSATIKQFNWKTPMKKVTCEAVNPPEMQITKDKNGVEYNMAWNDEVYEQATLYVPAGSVEAYKQAYEWKRFKNIQPIQTGFIDDTIIDEDSNAPVEYYNLQGIKVLDPHPGQLLIRRQGRKVTKVVI